LLRTAGVPAAHVSRGPDLIDHPQLRFRQRIFKVNDPVVGTIECVGLPMRFSHMPAMMMPGPAPMFGQHNRDVLTELGFSERDISDLAEAGVIGDVPLGMSLQTGSGVT